MGKCSSGVMCRIVIVSPFQPWLGSTLLLFVPAATALPIFESIKVQLGSRSVMKGWRNNSSATGRSLGLEAKHFLFRKSSATGERVTSSGTGGAARVLASLKSNGKSQSVPADRLALPPPYLTWNMAANASISPQGRLPAHISSTTHPRLQISTLAE